MKKIIFCLSFIIFFFPSHSSNASISANLSGKILLNVELNGEAWYVNPGDLKRYYLGRPLDAFSVMRRLGLGIKEFDFQKIAQNGMEVSGDLALAKKLSGRIVLQVEKNGEAWYINPDNLKKYYLGRPADAFAVMRNLGLGISRENLAKIHKPIFNESVNNYSKYEYGKIVNTVDGAFKIDIVEIDLSNPRLKITTPVADPFPTADKNGKYGADTLASFVHKNKGFAGINATYFCSSSSCINNYYFYPVYDSNKNLLINENELKYWTTGPIIAFDEKNKFYYFKDSREFPYAGWKSSSGSLADSFFNKYGVKLQAAIGNKPRLIEEYKNLLIEWDIDEKQKNAKSYRNAIAYDNNKIYLLIARDATVPNLANIIKALGFQYALNLDGGYSSALYYNDEYMVGPGRNITNAIIFSEN